MFKPVIAALLALSVSTTAIASDDAPVPGPHTLPRELCESLSDTYMRALLALIFIGPCTGRGAATCDAKKAHLKQIAQQAQDAYLGGNCSFWATPIFLVGEPDEDPQ